MLLYDSSPNLLLEALAYFGRRAAGNTIGDILRRLDSRGITDYAELAAGLAPLSRLTERLDREIPAEPETLDALFGSLPQMPRSTVGFYSPAFLLLYPHCSGSLMEAAQAVRSQSAEGLAGNLAVGLEIAEDGDGGVLSYADFSARVLAMTVPPEAKVAVLDLLHNPERVLSCALPLLQRAVAVLEAEADTLNAMSEQFGRELQRMGAEAFLARTSGLRSNGRDLLRPFLFGPDTNLSGFSRPGEDGVLYCGIFRMQLQDLLSRRLTPSEDVYEAIRLLADRTRFDILCYLKDRTAYGQELSEHFGLSRNTIHHHMSKLLSVHLVRCTVDGNRVYYTSDGDAIRALLEHQRALLLRGD